ncbi:T9SS type A sorting domain-containing protein [Caldithrix abyssi]
MRPVLSLFFLLFLTSFVFAQYNPTQNRARAYQDKGVLKLAIENYGRFGGVASPEGWWWDFQYISNLSFVMGIPGKDKNGNPYPWAVGPKTVYDITNNEFVTIGNDTTYWGATVSESWFDRTPALNRTDWEAVEDATSKLHNPNATAGNYYGRYGYYTNAEDSTPLIATSTIPNTWPLINGERVWPGRWAKDPADPSGVREIEGQFVSDQDIYFQFDDRLATRDVDPGQGYPMNVRVEVSSYSYADTSARDMIFFNLIIHNNSSYDYKEAYLGLYFDANVYSRLGNGSYSGRTIDDDMMVYDLENNMAYIYDLDGDHSNPFVGDKKLAFCAVKFLDTPTSSRDLDLNGDGAHDVAKNDKLGLTSWHWFDWYFRPGARDVNPTQGPWSGDGMTAVAANKEEIQYKIMAGDTTGLSAYDSTHYFHPPRTANGYGNLNPYFDSLDGLLYDYPEGLDCIFIMASGPFDLMAGDSVPFSFCLIMAHDVNQLKLRARTAQSIFENNYRLVPTAVEENKNVRPASGYGLHQNYPNPFNARTKIQFEIPKKDHVRLELFNSTGQKVHILLDKALAAGTHEVIWDAAKWPSGVYFYRLIVGQKLIATQKMLLLK